MHYKIILTLLISRNLLATWGVSDSLLYQTMMNTYNNSVELARIFEKQDLISKNIDKYVQQVEDHAYNAERLIIWAEDVKEIPDMTVSQFSEFNDLLRKIKESKEDLLAQANSLKVKYAEQERLEEKIDKKEKNVNDRKTTYKETPGKLDPAAAARATAKNTGDAKVELGYLNENILDLQKSIKKNNDHNLFIEEEIIKRKASDKEQIGILETKGPFKSNSIMTGNKNERINP